MMHLSRGCFGAVACRAVCFYHTFRRQILAGQIFCFCAQFGSAGDIDVMLCSATHEAARRSNSGDRKAVVSLASSVTARAPLTAVSTFPAIRADTYRPM